MLLGGHFKLMLASVCRRSTFGTYKSAHNTKIYRLCIPNPHYRRKVSTSYLHPSVRDFASELARKQPCFSVHPDNIRILSRPPEFYALLLDMIQRARHRIFISSLYIGSDGHELVHAVRTALDTHPSLQLHLLLDLNRSTRPGPTSTALLLIPLIRAFPSRVHVSLFRSPKLHGFLAKIIPPRFNEGWGTWHAKVYGIDNEVMISGANLNKSYFTNRQDRYIHFSANAELAQYCFDFLQTVSKFSFKLLPELASASSPSSCYRLEWPDPETDPHNIQQKAHVALSKFQASYLFLSSSRNIHPINGQFKYQGHKDQSQNVLIYPIIQAGQFMIREEESTLVLLFQHLTRAYLPTNGDAHENSIALPPRSRIDLTSGYFGLFASYQDLIIKSEGVDCRIVAASPKANGFFASRGISGRIPEGYTLLEQRFMKAVGEAGRSWNEEREGEGKGVQLTEWEREGWTYHAKGIWLSPTPNAPPVLTLFGSTNLNSRSAHLDTELSFLMILPETKPQTSRDANPDYDEPQEDDIGRRLANEVTGLRTYARAWKGAERRVSWATRLIVALVGSML